MNWSKKFKFFPLLVLVFSFLFSASLSSCEKKGNADENTEHPAGDTTEHPKGDNEHPKKDTTQVQQ